MFPAPMGDHSDLSDIRAQFLPSLDPDFQPISLVLRQARRRIANGANAVELTLLLERLPGDRSVHRISVPNPADDDSGEVEQLAERICKFLLWQQGASRVGIHSSDGSDRLAKRLAKVYSADGARAFDADMMQRTYGRPLVIESIDQAEAEATDTAKTIGGHLDGCRIGFDLGASDYKLAAVQDGEPVFTTEIPWDPRVEADPAWHRAKINEGLKLAAEKLPRVDAIGGSSAGIIVDCEPRVASLFRSVPDGQFAERVRPIFRSLGEEWGVPFEVANDGDVTALAGAMSLKTNGVLGLAMGSSQAVGFLDQQGRITGWLNELAFAPVDFHPAGPVDEWSGDIGCGVQYFSQQGVVRLATLAGIARGRPPTWNGPAGRPPGGAAQACAGAARGRRRTGASDLQRHRHLPRVCAWPVRGVLRLQPTAGAWPGNFRAWRRTNRLPGGESAARGIPRVGGEGAVAVAG